MRDTEIKLFQGSAFEPQENRACEDEIRALFPSWGHSPAGAEGRRLRLRSASPEDLAGIFALYGRPDPGWFAARCDLGSRWRMASTGAGAYMVYVSLLAYQVFIAEMDGALAGMLAVAVTHNITNGRTDGRVESLVASPDFDADVVCGSLLCFAVKYCRERSCGSLLLAVNEGDRGFAQFLRSVGVLDS